MFDFIIDFFTNKDNTIDISKIVFTLIGVLITTGISLVIAIINNSRSKKNLFINTITTNRITWMQNTRQMINDFIVLTETNTHTPIKISGESRFNYFNDLSTLRNRILLHLNSKGYLDQKIIKTINEIEYLIQLLADLLELFNSTDENKNKFIFKLVDNEHTNLTLEKILGFNSKDAKEIASKIQELGGIDELLDSKNDAIDSVITKQMQKINYNLKNIPREINKNINKLHNNLLIFTQVYMKVEWDRVKKESIGKFKEKENKKFKKKIDILIARANNSTYNYSFNKLEDYVKNRLEQSNK
ncbi:hypothetical protein [Bacillus altitudinis]|uniref:hypothetical protein n=1 Tax=Bacillus altitudinis TaxID=293387 RepID=UPI00064CB5EC|nr:hypothetical protein [Bacillus altitudinis]KLV22129.1 hypothetical protein ABW03_11260 [Bacillus altitudinis]